FLALAERRVLVAEDAAVAAEEEARAGGGLVDPLVVGVVPAGTERAFEGLAASVGALPDDGDEAGRLEVDGLGDELAGDDVDGVAGEKADDLAPPAALVGF